MALSDQDETGKVRRKPKSTTKRPKIRKGAAVWQCQLCDFRVEKSDEEGMLRHFKTHFEWALSAHNK
jgi:hypothetical protein